MKGFDKWWQFVVTLLLDMIIIKGMDFTHLQILDYVLIAITVIMTIVGAIELLRRGGKADA